MVYVPIRSKGYEVRGIEFVMRILFFGGGGEGGYVAKVELDTLSDKIDNYR